MSSITAAKKAERITQVVITSYVRTLDFHEDEYDRGATLVTVNAKDPRASLLDELLRFAQPQENECPPREITLQAVIDKMQAERDKLNEKWGPTEGEPRKLVLGWSISVDDARVVKAVMDGKTLDYQGIETVRKALVGESDW